MLLPTTLADANILLASILDVASGQSRPNENETETLQRIISLLFGKDHR